VAAAVTGGLHPLVLPQGCALPAIRYQMIDNPLEATHDGPTSLEHPRIQLTIHAATHAACEQASKALKLALHAQRRMGQAASFVTNEIDDYDTELRQFMRHVDVIAWREGDSTW
jgi:hypothetical protein